MEKFGTSFKKIVEQFCAMAMKSAFPIGLSHNSSNSKNPIPL